MATTSPKIPLTNKPGVKNWVEEYGALQPHDTNWIYRTAEHLKGKGMAEGVAIPTAVNAAQKLCETGDLNFPGLQRANLGSQAEACAAYKTWTIAKGRAHAAKAKSASNLTAQRACEEFRRIDLCRAYLDFEAGQTTALPRGATAAYLELSAQRSPEPVDLAYSPAEPRDETGRWLALAGKIAGMKSGGSVKVSRSFTVHHVPEASSGRRYRVTMKGATHGRAAGDQHVSVGTPMEAASVALGHSMNDKARLAARMRAQIAGL